ncbi:MAG: rhodanese-like domain-containing protein [Halobacteria archaeon]|nr:rhodanese-like domain-containing protein [Halobacteria archaeon]
MSSEISAEEAKKMMESEDVTVVDVRTPSEFEEGHIPGSMLVPMDEFTGHLGKLDGKEPIIMVCERGEASRQAAMLLDAYGGVDGDKVYNLREGLREWGGELVRDGDEETKNGN